MYLCCIRRQEVYLLSCSYFCGFRRRRIYILLIILQGNYLSCRCSIDLTKKNKSEQTYCMIVKRFCGNGQFTKMICYTIKEYFTTKLPSSFKGERDCRTKLQNCVDHILRNTNKGRLPCVVYLSDWYTYESLFIREFEQAYEKVIIY